MGQQLMKKLIRGNDNSKFVLNTSIKESKKTLSKDFKSSKRCTPFVALFDLLMLFYFVFELSVFYILVLLFSLFNKDKTCKYTWL